MSHIHDWDITTELQHLKGYTVIYRYCAGCQLSQRALIEEEDWVIEE